MIWEVAFNAALLHSGGPMACVFYQLTIPLNIMIIVFFAVSTSLV